MKYFIISLVFVGCTIPMGENVVFISGEVESKCQVIFYEENTLPQHFNSRDVEGNFTEDFVISPKPQNYRLEVNCSGTILLSKIVKYPEQIEQLNLGRLVLH